jgi:hypothetical protein
MIPHDTIVVLQVISLVSLGVILGLIARRVR